MTPRTRSALVQIATAAFALLIALAPARAAEPPRWQQADTLADLVLVLEDWLDRHSPYPARAARPDIRFVSRHRAHALAPSSAVHDGRRRGLYDPDAQTIYLVRPWSIRDAHDVSVLLHELVHHRQATARHWYCPGQQEKPAYDLQQAWLTQQGAKGRINWIAATLAAGCTPRDIHPD